MVSATKYNQWDNKLSSVSVSATPNASGIFIGSSAGSGATLSLVDGVNAGLLSAAMKAYWDGKLSSVSVFGSIQGNGIAPLQLKGDVTSPGANMVYGTNGAGVHVWKPETASGGSGESEWVKISIADLDASSGLDTKAVLIQARFTGYPIRTNKALLFGKRKPLTKPTMIRQRL